MAKALPSGLSQADAIAEIEDSGLKVTGATDELKEFMAVFAPMSKKGKLGGDLRKKVRCGQISPKGSPPPPFPTPLLTSHAARHPATQGFNFADPNGNGLCSLAEIENFILQSLMQAYPKDKTKKDDKGQDLERGRDLFDAFRPCYIRAYTDAKVRPLAPRTDLARPHAHSSERGDAAATSSVDPPGTHSPTTTPTNVRLLPSGLPRTWSRRSLLPVVRCRVPLPLPE